MSVIEEEVNLLTMYPNPSSEVVNFKTSNNSLIGTIVVYDAYGKMVYQNNINSQLELQISDWSKGLYFVKFGAQTLKLIVE